MKKYKVGALRETYRHILDLLSYFSLKKKGQKKSRQNDPLPRILSSQRTLNAVDLEYVNA